MLNLLDQLIQKVLDASWTTSPPPAKPGFYFTVPDEAWQSTVKSNVGMRLNIYLYEVRENTTLRRSSWDVFDLADHTATLSPPPAYFDCHYLISAWSPSEDSETISPVLDEHQVLSEALRVLLCNSDIVPGPYGLGGGQVFQQAHVYLSIAPPEAPRVLNDFWSTMKLPWRPAIQLIATAPLDLLLDQPVGPLVTTFIQRVVQINATGAADEWITMGGWVLKNSDSTPIGGATVTRVATGQAATTDAQGRYTFAGLKRGVHKLRAEASGFTAIERDVNIPDGPPDDHIFKLS